MDEEALRNIFRFYVALTSILGAFFYIHMGEWLQKVIQLKESWDHLSIKTQVSAEMKKEELQFKLKEYSNPVFGIVLAIVNFFVLLLLILALNAYTRIPNLSVEFVYYALPYSLFSILFFFCSVIFSVYGYSMLYKINKEVDKWLFRHEDLEDDD